MKDTNTEHLSTWNTNSKQHVRTTIMQQSC